MTLNDIYLKGKSILKEAGNESPAFDCICLLEHVFNVNRNRLITHGNLTISKYRELEFLKLINERAKGIPLQYLIGEWEFMGIKFKVGKGVLIPREDTEILVNECIRRISNLKAPKILDLCAGSGAVGISIALARGDAEVVCVEYSSEAFKYLKENTEMNEVKNITLIKDNIFSDILELKNRKFDMIVSNPPYVKTEDIKDLQIEVKNEPRIALDGGEDGLNFYREISKKWISYLNDGGILAVEIGIGQENDVINIFKCDGLCEISKIRDINNINRVILAIKRGLKI